MNTYLVVICYEMSAAPGVKNYTLFTTTAADITTANANAIAAQKAVAGVNAGTVMAKISGQA